MSKFGVYQDQGHYVDCNSLQEAIELAEVLLGGLPEGEEATFSVHDKEFMLMAAVTNRRIIGTFFKQRWGGRKNDDAIPSGEESFDATNSVLLLDHEKLIELHNDFELTDSIGRNYIDWDGPFEVALSDAVCEFFGVADIEEITPEALAFVRSRYNPMPIEDRRVILSLKVNLRVAPGVSIDSFMEKMDVRVLSQTPGITVANLEIVQ